MSDFITSTSDYLAPHLERNRVGACVCGARWGAEEMWVKVCLVIGGDNWGFIEGLVWK